MAESLAFWNLFANYMVKYVGAEGDLASSEGLKNITFLVTLLKVFFGSLSLLDFFQKKLKLIFESCIKYIPFKTFFFFFFFFFFLGFMTHVPLSVTKPILFYPKKRDFSNPRPFTPGIARPNHGQIAEKFRPNRGGGVKLLTLFLWCLILL
jgi:hypothetical protein